MKLLLLIAVSILTYPISDDKQQFTDSETLEVSLDGIDVVSLYNHWGDIKIVGSQRKNAQIKYTRKLKSASSRKLEEAKEEIQLKTLSENGELIIFVESPNLQFTIDADGRGHYRSPNWNEWRDRYEVSFEFEIVLEIPSSQNLKASNHHSGLEVSNISGDLYVHNHHKDLVLENVGDHVEASTHHGDIVVTHTENPSQDSYYKTHHGDIKVEFNNGLDAAVSLKSHHGSFYSDFDWKTGPLNRSVEKNGKETKYKIGRDTQVVIGNGGPQLDFRTHHGDIFLIAK